MCRNSFFMCKISQFRKLRKLKEFFEFSWNCTFRGKVRNIQPFVLLSSWNLRMRLR